MSLKNKVGIVTGGARGIGRAYSEALANAGAAVLIADLLEAEGLETVKAIGASGGRAAFQKVDVSDKASTEAMAARADAEFGGIDILVNNAAMFASLVGGPMDAISVERWDRTMAVNIRGPWLCMLACVPYMRKRGGGAIVNQTSISAFGMAYMLEYTASKAAVIGMTKSAASELGRENIRVNAIAPTAMGTVFHKLAAEYPGFAEGAAKMTPLGRNGDPEEDIGPALVFLASDMSRYVTGELLHVDGGLHMPGYDSKPPNLAELTAAAG